MNPRHLLLEVLGAVVSVLAWLFGYPALRTVSQALTGLAIAVVIVAALAVLGFAVVVIQSVRQPPYGS